MPKVSVILPSYNHKNYVAEAIESVLSQTFEDFEFLISDDCSTDGTAEVIKNYTDARIKIELKTINVGASQNLIDLIKKCKGQYVALINSDDVWMSNRLKEQITFLDGHTEIAAVFSFSKIIDEHSKEINYGYNDVFTQKNRKQNEWVRHLFNYGNCLCHPSILIKREVYHEVSSHINGLRQLPDFLMWIEVVKKHPIHIIPKKLVAHRRFTSEGENTSSITISNSVRDAIESYFILTERFFEEMSDDLFIKAFSAEFRNPQAKTRKELLCERFFLFLADKYYLPKISLQAAVIFYLKIINDPEIFILLKDHYKYTIDDFFVLSAQVDLLDLFCVASQEEYIRKNRFKALSWIMFKSNETKLYRFARKIHKIFTEH